MSKKKPQVWLVYDEGDAYEGGIEPLLVAATKASAEQAQAQADIKRVIELIRTRLERMPDPYENGISDDEWEARYAEQNRMLARVRWPHGLKRATRSWDFIVRVMPLPSVPEAR